MKYVYIYHYNSSDLILGRAKAHHHCNKWSRSGLVLSTTTSEFIPKLPHEWGNIHPRNVAASTVGKDASQPGEGKAALALVDFCSPRLGDETSSTSAWKNGRAIRVTFTAGFRRRCGWTPSSAFQLRHRFFFAAASSPRRLSHRPGGFSRRYLAVRRNHCHLRSGTATIGGGQASLLICCG